MNLNRAHQKFATVSIDGWDGTQWVESIAKGAMEVYSRFITERTFGAVKRLFTMPKEIPAQYTVVRMPDGAEYLLSKVSKDYRHDTVYGFVYLFQEVNGHAIVVSQTTKLSASGMRIADGEPTESAPIPCYFERYGATESSEADDKTYTRTRILLPKGTPLDVEDEIKIDTRIYSLDEVDLELDMTRAFGLER